MKQYCNSLSFAIRNMKVGESVEITTTRRRLYDIVWRVRKTNPSAQFMYTTKKIIRTA